MRLIASHGAPDDPGGALRRAGAPADLIDWTANRRIDTLWEECDRGDWLVWLAVVEKVPLAKLVEAAAACAERAMQAMPRDRGCMSEAIAAARALASPEDCHEHAKACEARAENPEAASYRIAPATAYQWAAHAAALCARAAEALLRAEARRAAERDREGRARAASIGAGEQIIGGGSVEPLCFDADDDWTGYCVDAASSSIRAAGRALAPAQPDERMLEEIEGELSEVVFAVLDPVRRGLREGRPPEELVPELSLAPYRSTASEVAEQPITANKHAATALAAALVLPIGGGHYYAGQRETAFVLTCGILGGFAGSFLWTHLATASVVLIAADALLAPGAARRFNADRTLGTAAQLALGFALVALAFSLAVATS